MTDAHESCEWLVLGNGSVGMSLAYHLQSAGGQVRVLDRSGKRARKTLVFNSFGEPTSPIHWECSFGLPLQPPDIQRVLVATKTFSVGIALGPLIKHLTPGSRVYFFQNGLDFLPRELLPPGVESLFVVNPGFSVNRIDHRTVEQTGYAPMLVGDLVGTVQPPPRVQSDLEQLRAAGIDLSWTSGIQCQRWKKLAINAVINPLTVIHELTNGELATHSEARVMIDRMCGECVRIMESLGHSFSTDELRTSVLGVLELTARNRSSMLQDYHAKRSRNELDHIMMPFIKQARSQAVDCPTLEAVHRRVFDLFSRASSIESGPEQI
ncbi:MAG: hypothetical protein CBC35_02480 [Planctomycetes bacterium TMED75]|nr:hypothetical protein [Planctomycetaceae bacterium]OUU95731.1 MAG: hypothetical protein CBC35_02480 [Planctomycetes bacterium TMED75]